jgi:hypothetical protein
MVRLELGNAHYIDSVLVIHATTMGHCLDLLWFFQRFHSASEQIGQVTWQGCVVASMKVNQLLPLVVAALCPT